MPVATRGFTPYAKHKVQHEHSELDKVCRYLDRNYPNVVYFTDYAAGLNLTDKERQKMMRQRSHDGMQDLTILEPRQGYHGMVVEFKKTGVTVYRRDGLLKKQSYNRRYHTSKGLVIKSGDHLLEQARVLTILRVKGYYACWGLGYLRTIEMIDTYMGVLKLFSE